MMNLNDQRIRAQEVSEQTGIPVENIMIDQDGGVRAYLPNLRLNGWTMVVVEEWLDIDPNTFSDYMTKGV